MENSIQLGTMLIHYGLNLTVAFVFIVLIYNRFRRHELGYVFTYFLFNTIDALIRENTEAVIASASAEKITPREAAIAMAQQRVREAVSYSRWK